MDSHDRMPAPHEVPLTPLQFLDRCASAFSDRIAIVDGDRRFTYSEFANRVHRLAGLLRARGIRPGDRVAAICTNSHVMLELLYGVPMAGAVVVPVNIRLSAAEMAEIVQHSGARLLVATRELAEAARQVAAQTGVTLLGADFPEGEYEQKLASAPWEPTSVKDEHEMLAINYTSGSTGKPKGVIYTHRGAFLQALAVAYLSRLSIDSAYLWTLPMFHCNGWCFTWAVTAAGGTHMCQRRNDPPSVWRMICDGRVTHLCGAPTLLTMIAEAADAAGGKSPLPVWVGTGGAPPTPALLARLARLNMAVTHMYGLTETYGPVAVNQWQPEWSQKSVAEQARLNARQGIGNIVARELSVIDIDGKEVPADGETQGEIAVRGGNVTPGYYRDEEATRAAQVAGWFRTGDIGVRYPDGYVELRDRSKDIIISGGENISSVEVERVLVEHPAVLEAAVVGRADSRWGEVPVAFVVLRPGMAASEAELIEFVRERIAHFKAPKEIRFEALPVTSTGKVQKHVLRKQLTDSANVKRG